MKNHEYMLYENIGVCHTCGLVWARRDLPELTNLKLHEGDSHP